MRLWCKQLSSIRLVLHCDNMAVIGILTGKGYDALLLAIARNIWLTAAAADIDVKFVHIPGKINTVADVLSRWLLPGSDNNKLYQLIEKPQWESITNEMFYVDMQI